jgi:hypothetical protein
LVNWFNSEHMNYTSTTTRAMNPATSMTSGYETYVTPTRTAHNPLQGVVSVS